MDASTLQRFPAAESSTTKFLLFALPAELRDCIYDLVFSTTKATDLDLRLACPPSKALLMTCRQIYNEARLMHGAAYRAFWTNTAFVFNFTGEEGPTRSEAEEFLRAVEAVRPEDLDHITSFSINLRRAGRPRSISLERGIWIHSEQGSPRSFHAFIPVGTELLLDRGARVWLMPASDRAYWFATMFDWSDLERMRAYKADPAFCISTRQEILLQAGMTNDSPIFH